MKTTLRKKGDRDRRMRNHARNVLTFDGTSLYDGCKTEATALVHSFLFQRMKLSQLNIKIKVFINRIKNIQRNYRLLIWKNN